MYLTFKFLFSPRPKAVTPPYFSDGVVNKGLEGVSDDITKAGIYTTNTSGLNGGMNGHIPSSSHPNSGENYTSSFAYALKTLWANKVKTTICSLYLLGHLSCHFFSISDLSFLTFACLLLTLLSCCKVSFVLFFSLYWMPVLCSEPLPSEIVASKVNNKCK